MEFNPERNFAGDWGGIHDTELAQIDDVVQSQIIEYYSGRNTTSSNSSQDMYGGITDADMLQLEHRIQNSQQNINDRTQK